MVGWNIFPSVRGVYCSCADRDVFRSVLRSSSGTVFCPANAGSICAYGHGLGSKKGKEDEV